MLHPCLIWPFVRGIHRSQLDSPHKGQWRGALMFSLICAWTNGWANNQDVGDLRRHRARYDVTVMIHLRRYGPFTENLHGINVRFTWFSFISCTYSNAEYTVTRIDQPVDLGDSIPSGWYDSVTSIFIILQYWYTSLYDITQVLYAWQRLYIAIFTRIILFQLHFNWVKF